MFYKVLFILRDSRLYSCIASKHADVSGTWLLLCNLACLSHMFRRTWDGKIELELDITA